jgi:hypothetical protein
MRRASISASGRILAVILIEGCKDLDTCSCGVRRAMIHGHFDLELQVMKASIETT